MSELKQSEESPALGTSKNLPKKVPEDSNDPTMWACVSLLVLQASWTWDGGFWKLSPLLQTSVFYTLQERGFQQILQSHAGRKASDCFE